MAGAKQIWGRHTDVTERRRTEKALQESEERYTLAMQATEEVLYEWNLDADKLYYSPHVRFFLGLPIQAVGSRKDWLERIHPDDRERYRETYVALLKGETERLNCEARFRGNEDEWRWARQHAVAVRDETGRAHRIVGASSDITERKRIEIELAETSAAKDAVLRRLNAVLDHISYGVLFAEADLRARVGNRAYREMWGIPDKFLAGNPTFSELIEYNRGTGIYEVADDQWDEYVEARVNAIKSGNIAPTEFRLGNGKIVQYQCIALPDGGRMVTYFDITELKRREEELAEKTAMLESLSVKLSKYLSPQIYNSIFSGQQTAEIASERKKLTIFFSDIAGFTAAADSLESEELTGLLNQYLTEMSNIALKHGATIDKYVGDAIMVFFGDPESKGVKKDAIACVEMAIAMQRRMAELQNEWRDQGIEYPFQLRIGINTGYCTVGNFGSEDRMDYTIIGNEVNLAARLQSHAELGGILLANETYSLVKGIVLTGESETITAKGFAKPLRTYKVVGLYDDLADQGRVIRLDEDGLMLTIDQNKLTKETINVLKDVVSQLKD